MREHPRVNVLGVGVSAVDMASAVDTIAGWIARREQHYVCVTPVNPVVEAQRDERLKRVLNASGLTVPDGMPLVWLCRWAGYRHVERVYGPDLMLQVCARAAREGYSAFLYGARPGVAEELAGVLCSRFPGLRIAGTFTPQGYPLPPAEDEQVVARINAAAPDIVWVGLGNPRQDFWVAEHAGRVEAPALIGVGAAFDFHTGRVKQAPRWMQRAGLEWLFRLSQEPRRLWRRYLIGNPLFVLHLLLMWTGLRRYPLPDERARP